MNRAGAPSIVGIDTLEHAQSVLKGLRCRSSAARNYQTIEQVNLAEGTRGLQDFNGIVVEKGKEVARKQEQRQKELAILDLIGAPQSGSTDKTSHSISISHTLRSDRYELSPSKLASISKDGCLDIDAPLYASGSGVLSAKMERMALNRPRKAAIRKVESKYNDDDLLDSDDDLLFGAHDDPAGPDSPPRGFDDELKYDSDDDVEPLTLAEKGLDKNGNNFVKKTKNSSHGQSGLMTLKQGTTSQMTNGVKNQLISSHSSQNEYSEMSSISSRITVHNSVEADITTAEGKEFAEGLKYMMEASLNEPDSSHRKPPGYSAEPIGSKSMPLGTNARNQGPSNASLSGSLSFASGHTSKSALAIDIAKNKGVVLKKGGMFVRAGGRKARQMVDVNQSHG